MPLVPKGQITSRQDAFATYVAQGDGHTTAAEKAGYSTC